MSHVGERADLRRNTSSELLVRQGFQVHKATRAGDRGAARIEAQRLIQEAQLFLRVMPGPWVDPEDLWPRTEHPRNDSGEDYVCAHCGKAVSGRGPLTMHERACATRQRVKRLESAA